MVSCIIPNQRTFSSRLIALLSQEKPLSSIYKAVLMCIAGLYSFSLASLVLIYYIAMSKQVVDS